MTQRGQGPVISMRTSGPIAMRLADPLILDKTFLFARYRRQDSAGIDAARSGCAAQVPPAVQSAVVSKCRIARSKKVPGGMASSVTTSGLAMFLPVGPELLKLGVLRRLGQQATERPNVPESIGTKSGLELTAKTSVRQGHAHRWQSRARPGGLT